MENGEWKLETGKTHQKRNRGNLGQPGRVTLEEDGNWVNRKGGGVSLSLILVYPGILPYMEWQYIPPLQCTMEIPESIRSPLCVSPATCNGIYRFFYIDRPTPTKDLRHIFFSTFCTISVLIFLFFFFSDSCERLFLVCLWLSWITIQLNFSITISFYSLSYFSFFLSGCNCSCSLVVNWISLF